MVFLISVVLFLYLPQFISNCSNSSVNLIWFSFQAFRSFYQVNWQASHAICLIAQFEHSAKWNNCRQGKTKEWLTILMRVHELIRPGVNVLICDAIGYLFHVVKPCIWIQLLRVRVGVARYFYCFFVLLMDMIIFICWNHEAENH